MNTSNNAREAAISSPNASAMGEARRVTATPKLRAAKSLFLFAAGISFLFSIYLWFLVDREQGLFVGIWVPSILALGSLLLAGKGDE